jgi:NAD+ diphosphatase
MSSEVELPPFERAAHLRKQLDFLEAELHAPGSLIVPMWRAQNLIAGERGVLLELGRAPELVDQAGELVWLGKLGEASCFALDLSNLPDPRAHALLAESGEFKELRGVAAMLPADQAALLAYARGLLFWHTRTQYCGACGERTAPRQGGHVRVCRRESCALEHFPRTDPAIIVLVHDGDDCLLGRQRSWPRGMYSTLAGFVEPGETIEQAVAREVAEESGVLVSDVRYFRSQPWPFPSSLMIGFSARATSRAIDIGDDELEDAQWVSKADLQASARVSSPLEAAREQRFFVPGTYSLSGQLIDAFLRGEIG